MKRPIVTIVIGYLIGIIYGLYFEKSIVLFFAGLLAIYYFFLEILKKKKVIKYLKFLLTKQIITCIVLVGIVSNFYILYKDKNYNNFQSELEEKINITGIIISSPEEKEYSYLYKIKEIDSRKCFLLYVSKSSKNIYEYGDLLKISADVIKPSQKRNYKGFDYKSYLKSKKIYAILKSTNYIELLEKNKASKAFTYANKLKEEIIKGINKFLPGETGKLLIGILLGDKTNIDEDILENFQKTSVLHILSVSGMHISYITLFIIYLLDKLNVYKKTISVVTIIALMIFMFITGFSPSVVRASIMGIVALGANIFYRRNDISTSIALSLLIILVYNPFLMNNIGLRLSYGGTIGILLLQKILAKKIKFNLVSVSLSAQIMIMPICAYSFNEISLIFLISNILIGSIIGVIVILGIITVLLYFIIPILPNLIAIILNVFLKYLIFITEFLSKIPYSSIIVVRPYIINVILYYLIFIYICYINNLNKKEKRLLKKYEKFILKLPLKRILIYILILIIMGNVIFKLFIMLPSELKIYFIDVGQRR